MFAVHFQLELVILQGKEGKPISAFLWLLPRLFTFISFLCNIFADF